VLRVTNFDKIQNILNVSTPKINVMTLNYDSRGQIISSLLAFYWPTVVVLGGISNVRR
jgi:hypothetical protein